MKQTIFFAMSGMFLIAVTVLGILSTIQLLTMPDGVRLAVEARRAGVTVDDATIVKTLTEANLTQARAQSENMAGWTNAIGAMVFPVLCLIVVPVGSVWLFVFMLMGLRRIDE